MLTQRGRKLNNKGQAKFAASLLVLPSLLDRRQELATYYTRLILLPAIIYNFSVLGFPPTPQPPGLPPPSNPPNPIPPARAFPPHWPRNLTSTDLSNIKSEDPQAANTNFSSWNCGGLVIRAGNNRSHYFTHSLLREGNWQMAQKKYVGSVRRKSCLEKLLRSGRELEEASRRSAGWCQQVCCRQHTTCTRGSLAPSADIVCQSSNTNSCPH